MEKVESQKDQTFDNLPEGEFTLRPLTGSQMISFNDMIIILVVFIDFFQYLAVGPEFRSLSYAVWEVSKAISVDLSQFISFDEGVYWAILNSMYALSFLFFVCCVVVLLKLDIHFEHSEICREFGYYAEVLLPILSNAFFLPVISIHFDVFICSNSVGPDYSDSYLDKDCHVWCW
jgi:hypothetical protein